MGTILLIILILLLIGALPAWPYSSGWGYWPSGGPRIDTLDHYNSRFDGTPLNHCGVSANGHLCVKESHLAGSLGNSAVCICDFLAALDRGIPVREPDA
jgi:Protein of unknown function (DUF3309)